MKIIEFAGRPNNALLELGEIALVVTMDVGPRILSVSQHGGPNHLAVYDRHHGLMGGEEYRSYGGHRLWTAPEIPARTYEPDNAPVEVQTVGEEVILRSSKPSAVGLQRSLAIQAGPKPNSVRVRQEVRNIGDNSKQIAAWAISVMAPGGKCIFPQAEFVPHGESLLPARPLVLWPYARMADPRWTWGDELVQLRQADSQTPQKIGAFVQQGWAAYARAGEIFIKQFPAIEEATYPDFGCNFEVFTRHDMLEVESLSPLVELKPGESVQHEEIWTLSPFADPASQERDLLAQIESLISSN